jgi:flavin-dependent dehydrogenase
VDLPADASDQIYLIGDAGIVVRPFTGSGIFEGLNNARDLVAALEEYMMFCYKADLIFPNGLFVIQLI